MTIDFNNHTNINAEIRKRRRKLALKRRRALSLKLRGYIVIGIICILTLMTGCLAVYGGNDINGDVPVAIQEEVKIEYQTVTIRGGDTLWSIASAHSDSSTDVRELVREIRKLNDIEPGSIYPGQIIKVPV